MPPITDGSLATPVDKKELRKQFLWLYGVIVGLVIREATTRVVPIFTHPTGAVGWVNVFFFARYAVLMLMVIRFFLGAVTVLSIDSDENSSSLSDGVSLLSGLAHFVLFFAWASTLDIDPATRSHLNLSPFEILLLLVLMYDVAWWLASAGHRFEKLNLWTVVNVVTTLICLVVHMGLAAITSRWRTVECIVFFPVMIISLIDISEILAQRELFRKWFRAL